MKWAFKGRDCFLKTYTCKLVEPPEELVEQPDQFLCGALGREAGEADNVRKEDAGREKTKMVSCKS